MDFKTNYIGHDGIYKRKKENGEFLGWSVSEQFDHNISVIKKVLDHKNAPSTGKLLEIGCGAGDISIWFAQQGYQTCGMDIAPAAINWAVEKAIEAGVQADFQVGNVVLLEEFEENTFDLVIDGHCLHCIIGKDRAELLSNVYRILKPGGYCMINTMCTPVDADQIINYDPESRCTFHDGCATRYWGHPEEILEEMKTAGFNVVWSEVRLDQPDDPNHGIQIELNKPVVA